MIKFQKVDGYVRNTIPEPHENILTYFNFNIPTISEIAIYLRDPKDCPFRRGNWVIDVCFNDSEVACFKLPKEMEEEQVMHYMKPLLDILEDIKAQH